MRAGRREGRVRRALEALYEATGALAGLSLAALLGCVLYSMGGALLGYIPRGAEDFAGYAMIACAAFGFAYGFARHAHIRVTLIAGRLHGRARRAVDILSVSAAVIITGYLAWFSIKLTWQSWAFDFVSQGLVTVPLWIPQLSLALGSIVFCIAVLDKAVCVVLGEPLDPAEPAPARGKAGNE